MPCASRPCRDFLPRLPWRGKKASAPASPPLWGPFRHGLRCSAPSKGRPSKAEAEATATAYLRSIKSSVTSLPSFRRKPECRVGEFARGALDTGFRRYDSGFSCGPSLVGFQSSHQPRRLPAKSPLPTEWKTCHQADPFGLPELPVAELEFAGGGVVDVPDDRLGFGGDGEFVGVGR